MNKKEWFTKIELYQPYEAEQILLPEQASCLAVKTFLRMCNIDYEILVRPNVEFISPGGRLTKVPVVRAGIFVASEFLPIVELAIKNEEPDPNSTKEDEDVDIDLKANLTFFENVFTCAEYFVCFKDKKTYKDVTKARIANGFPWPLSIHRCVVKKKMVNDLLKTYQWHDMDIVDVLEKVENCCKTLSNILETNNNPFFYSKEPCELDALIFGHLFSILTTDLPNNVLAKTVLKYNRLVEYCNFIEETYFKIKHD